MQAGISAYMMLADAYKLSPLGEQLFNGGKPETNSVFYSVGKSDYDDVLEEILSDRETKQAVNQCYRRLSDFLNN